MKIKIDGLDGLDEFSKKLKKMARAAKELDGTHEVPFSELFTFDFMMKYTSFTSFDELLEAGGFVVNGPEDFKAIPDDVFDQHISKNTQFDSWQDMLGKAGTEYAMRKIGF